VTPTRTLILGAGPTGLGAAWRLHELGRSDWLLLEAAPGPGGLAASFVDDRGFTWDMGGHVLFSHYPYFDRLMDLLLPEGWVEHVREAWVYVRNRWVPYPFQNNIWMLPPDDLLAALTGLLDARPQTPRDQSASPGGSGPANFRAWLLQTFGPGLCEIFMFPYNRKVWAYDPATLDVGWMGERVAPVDLRRVLTNLVYQRPDVGWGPNSTFRFPRRGGTGAIWHALARRLPAEKLLYGQPVTAIDPQAHTATRADGRQFTYENLVSSMPLDDLLRCLRGCPDLSAAAPACVYSSTYVIGVGLDGTVPAALKTKCWMYFPESNSPYYRVTVFSNYSPHNTPQPGKQWSLMAEVSESPEKPVNRETVVSETLAALRQDGLIPPGAPILSTCHRRLEHGYPTPWLGRDRHLDPLLAHLADLHIFSRGRFGAWKYEVSNQDHSLMQGVEVINRLEQGQPEMTLFHPAVVNARPAGQSSAR
jgi:protoporphyrinogen oxidase